MFELNQNCSKSIAMSKNPSKMTKPSISSIDFVIFIGFQPFLSFSSTFLIKTWSNLIEYWSKSIIYYSKSDEFNQNLIKINRILTLSFTQNPIFVIRF